MCDLLHSAVASRLNQDAAWPRRRRVVVSIPYLKRIGVGAAWTLRLSIVSGDLAS
jgi:hypothetical protein